MSSAQDLISRAAAARVTHDYADAAKLYRLALAQAPEDVTANHDFGATLRDLGLYEEAEAQLWRTMLIHPNAGTQHVLSQVLMARGKFREALYHRHALHKLPGMPPRHGFAKPEWRGEDLRGKHLVVLPDQGLGDQLMTARFFPRLQALGAEVTLICQPPVARLLKHNLSIRVLAAEGSVSVPRSHYWTTNMDLIGHLAATPADIPVGTYLAASKIRSLGDGFKVGLATQGNPKHPNDAYRSLGKADAARLTAIIGAPVPLDQAALKTVDMAETAEVVAGLDLVVTVDTSIAHLAGAMGKPVWILVPGVHTDWRWGAAGTPGSAWYPSARLFWSDAKGRWDPGLDALEAALATTREARLPAS